MRKILFLFAILLVSNLKAQSQMDPLVILDAKKIGYMKDIKEQMEAIKPEDVSSITVFKDSLAIKKYQSNTGVIVITTKKYILDTFYKNFIENSPLKENIKSPNDLIKIGVINENQKSNNQPYDELHKYIDTYTLTEKIAKISKITYLKPDDAVKLNPKWTNGAIEIDSLVE